MGVIGARHGQSASGVFQASRQRLAAFVLNGGTGFFLFVLGVVAPALDHEACNHAVKNGAVVVFVIHVLQEIGHGFGRLVGIQLSLDVPHRSADADFADG